MGKVTQRLLVPNLQTTYELKKSSVTVVPAWKSWAESRLQQTLRKGYPASLRGHWFSIYEDTVHSKATTPEKIPGATVTREAQTCSHGSKGC